MFFIANSADTDLASEMGSHCFSMYLLSGFTVAQGLSNLLRAFSSLSASHCWDKLP